MGDVAMAAAATARLEWMDIPTCPIPPHNPYPSFDPHRYRSSYPYAKQTDLAAKPVPTRHRVVVLENRYVRATVLVDLGGRLFSLFDKVAGQETFMVPPTLKFQNVSNRGAWLAGGIEFNFGQRGHSLLTVAPLAFCLREAPDGSAAVWIGSVTRPTENRYAVCLSLKPDRAALDVDIHTMAPPDLPGLMYWWSNAGVEVTPHSRFFYFGLHADAMHSRHGWPIADGKDFSWYRNRVMEADMFLLEPQRDYLGFYDFGRHHGLTQTADRFKAPGQKYFTWGTHHQGRFWDAMFSDSGQTYAEIQRGRLPTQGLTEPIPPMTSADWEETWAPIRGTEGFSAVEGELVLSVTREGDETVIRLQGLRPLAGLRMEARAGETVLGRWDIDRTDPETTIVQRLARTDVPACDRIVVTAADGKTLLDWTEFKYLDEDWFSEAREHPKHRRGPGDAASADDLFHQSERARFGDWPAVPDYVRQMQDKVLEKDPGHAGVLKARAETHLFRGEYDQAAASVQEALRRDVNNPDLLLLDGWARLYAGRAAEAVDVFRTAARYQTHRTGAVFGWTCAALAAGRADAALAAAEELHRAEPADPWGRLARVMALRGAGHAEQAREAIVPLLAEEPLWTRAHAEAFLLNVPVEIADGSRRFADDSVTAALPYVQLGLWPDAVRLLETDEQNEPFSPAVRLAHLAYAQLKAGNAPAAAETMRRLAAAPVEYAHPWATASIDVMRELHRAFSDQPMPLHMLGNLLAARDLPDQAEAAWKQALALGMSHSVLLRDLAVAAAGRGDHDEALKLYRRAWQAADGNRHLFTELDRYLADRGLHEERLKLYAGLPAESQARSMVAMRRVLMLLDAGRWDEALAELSARQFLRGEFEKTIHYNWVEAVVGSALAPIAAGDWAKARAVLLRGLEYPRNLNIGRHGATPNESMANYLLGVVAELAGDAEEASRRYTLAAEETHTEGTPGHAYEMLAWLARGNRVRGMGIAHRIEQMARGEIDVPNWLRQWYPESILKLSHGLVQVARGRTDEARAMWQAALDAECDARWVKLHLAMPPVLLEKMARLPEWPDSAPTV